MRTGLSEETAVVTVENKTESCPAGTVTLTGTEATPGSEDDKNTTPPVRWGKAI
jgi:hypothetical protein